MFQREVDAGAGFAPYLRSTIFAVARAAYGLPVLVSGRREFLRYIAEREERTINWITMQPLGEVRSGRR